MQRMLALTVALSMLSMPAGGCAYFTIRGPGELGPQRPDCTKELGPAYIDAGVGTAAGLAGIVGGLQLIDDHGTLGGATIVVGVVTLLAFYGSATIGTVRAKRCKEALAEWNFRFRNQ
ncbi:MAG TPA: hypothetical protein VFQ53_27175 [Kofleriaceae bacterium]|nr:hypothetical protein [Kofleriaceae bacterium]